MNPDLFTAIDLMRRVPMSSCAVLLVTQIRGLRVGVASKRDRQQSEEEVVVVGGIITVKSKFFGLEVLETMDPSVFLLPLHLLSSAGRSRTTAPPYRGLTCKECSAWRL